MSMLSILLLLSHVSGNELLWLLRAFTTGLRAESFYFLLVSKISGVYDKFFC